MLDHDWRSYARIAPSADLEPAPRPRRRWVRPDVPRPEAPKPRLTEGLSRRDAVVVSLAGLGLGLAGLCLPVKSRATALSSNDARLVALADAYEALDREVAATHSTAPGYDALICRYTDLEAEAAEIPADSLAGVAAKARLCQSPAARGCADFDHILSVVDDVHRLVVAGGLA